ncbi:hypothetical protein SAMN05216330_108127 [Bradyrhizobium sp. Ghvi]|uniref:hypothetical protein n=1 Tax=Bradyrhizobium sp. Ghvi TaxID=1855319 RepID=UPI0008DFFFBC|nr:hypothetical protein [Bradyrhizobium sp. Ghvi]SFP55803.1 hypothetical protein SAMN05216330_108127 [Bradyrhizobium sp. Ghvi]
MTPALLIARDCIIYWVNVWIAPVEYVFDMIETELARRGVASDQTDNLPLTV